MKYYHKNFLLSTKTFSTRNPGKPERSLKWILDHICRTFWLDKEELWKFKCQIWQDFLGTKSNFRHQALSCEMKFRKHLHKSNTNKVSNETCVIKVVFWFSEGFGHVSILFATTWLVDFNVRRYQNQYTNMLCFCKQRWSSVMNSFWRNKRQLWKLSNVFKNRIEGKLLITIIESSEKWLKEKQQEMAIKIEVFFFLSSRLGFFGFGK